jgi:hypothetical protein
LQSRAERLFHVLEDEAVRGQSGDGEDAKDLSGGGTGDHPPTLFSEPLMGVDNRRDPGRIDEFATLEINQDLPAFGTDAYERLLQLLRNRKVQLTLHLDPAAVRTEIFLNEFESSQMRQLTPSEFVLPVGVAVPPL